MDVIIDVTSSAVLPSKGLSLSRRRTVYKRTDLY